MKLTRSRLRQIIKEELTEAGAFASDEEIQAITSAAEKVDSNIRKFSEFYEAVRIAWNEGAFKYEPSRHEIREAWKLHPGNMFTHDQRTGIKHR